MGYANVINIINYSLYVKIPKPGSHLIWYNWRVLVSLNVHGERHFTPKSLSCKVFPYWSHNDSWHNSWHHGGRSLGSTLVPGLSMIIYDATLQSWYYNVPYKLTHSKVRALSDIDWL